MSFKAVLTADDKEFKVSKISYTINRAVDELGRLTSSIVGGQIDLEIKSSKENMFFEHVCESEPIKKGKVVFNKRHEDATMRELSFEKAFVASYTETFDHTGYLGTMTLSVTLVTKVLRMGNGELGNDFFDFSRNR